MQKRIKEEKGITLVALVITIIILLILAGVALSLVIGKNGLIAKSKEGVDTYKEKAKEEQWQLEDLETGMEEIDSAELEDEEEHPELKQMKLVLNITEDNKTIQLPVYRNTDKNYTYDCTVNWGDNEESKVTSENAKTIMHTYENTGTYTVTIDGTYECLYTDYEKNTSVKNTLIEVKQWGATKLKRIQLEYCEKLTKIATPSKSSFSNITEFQSTFYRCSSLTNIPERLFANCPKVTDFSYTFFYCKNLTSIPEKLFVNCSNVTGFQSTFVACEKLMSIPERLFFNCPNVRYFCSTFSYCTGITSIPRNLFSKCHKVIDFESAFAECTNLTGQSIQLWNEGREGVDENNGGAGCYAYCEKLDDYDSIPNYWKVRQDS